MSEPAYERVRLLMIANSLSWARVEGMLLTHLRRMERNREYKRRDQADLARRARKNELNRIYRKRHREQVNFVKRELARRRRSE